MKIAIIGPGEMTIPPKGWGAVESLIYEYFQELSKLGHEVLIVNTKNTKKIINDVNTFKPDFVHCQYDNFIDILEEIDCPQKAITSHYGYLDQVWNADRNYLLKIHKRIVKAKNIYIFALSKSIADRYIADGVDSNRVFIIPNGVNIDKFERKKSPVFRNRSIYLAKVDSRKRQGLFQNIGANIFFAGNLCKSTAKKSGFDSANRNYLGEWSKDIVYKNLTDYANLVLLSDGEAHPLVCLEALASGLGLVISEFATANLDLSKPFIDVIPESKIKDFDYVKKIIIENRKKSITQRKEIISYAHQFRWELIVSKYIKTIQGIKKNKKILEKKSKIAIVIIATGNYHDLFVKDLKSSVFKYFPNKSQIKIYCFSDTKNKLDQITYFKTPHTGWPFDTLLRYKIFESEIDELMKNDLIYYVDADMKFINKVPQYVFNKNLVLLRHIGFLPYTGTYEIEKSESTYVEFKKRKNYVQGCFWGGEKIDFRLLINTLARETDQDLILNKIPVWHDESYLNKYVSNLDFFLLPKNFSSSNKEVNSNTILLHVEKQHLLARNKIKKVIQIDSQKILQGLNEQEKISLFEGLYLNAHDKNQQLEKMIIKREFILNYAMYHIGSIINLFKKFSIRSILKFFYLRKNLIKKLIDDFINEEKQFINQELVSVLMPVFNAEKSIVLISKSILNQTYKNFEFIIINDGSTDSTIDKLRCLKDDRIKIFSYKKNKGIVHALNYGLTKCQGAYIARADADDFSLSTRLEKQVNFLDVNPSYGACGTFQKIIFRNSHSINTTAIKDAQIRTSLLFGTTMLHSTMMIRKSTLDKLGRMPYKEKFKYCEDYKLWVDLSKITKMYNIPQVLCHYDWTNTKSWEVAGKDTQMLLNEIRIDALENLVFFKFQRKVHQIHQRFFTKINYKLNIKLLMALYILYLSITLFVLPRQSLSYIFKKINYSRFLIAPLVYLASFLSPKQKSMIKYFIRHKN